LDRIERITASGRNEAKGKRLVSALGPTSKTLFIQVDLSDPLQTHSLVRDHDIVFHCAAMCEPWGRWEDFISSNVTATQNVAHACRMSRSVRLLVYISTPSVCFSVDTKDRLNVKEYEPLPPDNKQASRYAATKKSAEIIVNDVAKRFSLPCVILRPRAIFGPGDTSIFPYLVKRLKSGGLRIVGDHKKCVGDFTHVDNVVYACLCCVLKPPSAAATYSITNDDPQRLWDIIEAICDKLKLESPKRHMPRLVAYYFAYVCEWYGALRLLLGDTDNPFLTRYAVNFLSRSCTLDVSAAKEELGYRPVVPFADGFRRFLDTLESSSS
jgi:nucleoside-diphosphate-sugar epimerase